ncbi:hypothetical protein BVRB_4g074180 [Beta vulgaris subsp. vulgaris]|nr:hypothetical protein BVRB_4g074180 [Beta vulgaris subsp. vulgaris]
MASIQQVEGAKQFSNDKEKAVINEMLEAAKLMEKNDDQISAQQQEVKGYMKNKQARPVNLRKTYELEAGKFIKKPTQIISGDESQGSFWHVGVTGPAAVGSKGAVIYGHYDNNLPQLGWLLAWYKAENPDERKVYVETGYLSRLINLEDNEVEQKLDASTNSSRYVDNDTGASAAGEMIPWDKTNQALVGAAFIMP